MRRFPSSWDKTLTALGFRRRVKRVKRNLFRRQGHLQSLEPRQLLAGDTPTPLQAEYHFAFSETEEELAALPFVLTTEYDGASPRAVLTLDEDAGPVDYGLHEFSIELRLGAEVLETQEIAVNLTTEDFQRAFYKDRVQSAGEKTLPVSIAEIESWRERLDSAGHFTDLQSAVSAADPLLTGAQRLATMASLHQTFGNLLAGVEDRQRFYLGVLQTASAIPSQAGADQYAELRAELGKTALLIGDQLKADLATGELHTTAAQVRDALLATVDPYYTVLGTYHANTELTRLTSGGTRQAVAVVEEGVFEVDDRLRVELGQHTAFVGATITTAGVAASMAGLSAVINAADDATLSTVSGVDETATTISLVTDSSGAVVAEGHVRLDLASEADKTPTRATLVVGEDSVSPQDLASLRLRQTWDAWGANYDDAVAGDWVANSDADRGLGLAPTLISSGVYEFDVTEAVQRSLLFGDANADGATDHDYDGSLNRRGLAADVNAAYLAIRDWDRYRELYGGLEQAPGDLLYRVDGNWDGAATPADGQLLLHRLGVKGGDFDLDGDVDVADLAAYQANYGKAVHQFAAGDADFNGVVNAYDEDIWDVTNDANNANTDVYYRAARPHFELYLDGEGTLELLSSESGSGPQLELDYDAGVRLVDVHARGTLLGGVEGKVVINYQATNDAATSITDAMVQLYRVPASGAPMQPIGSPAALDPFSVSDGLIEIKLADLSDGDLAPGDSLAVSLSSDALGIRQVRHISEGIVASGASNLHAFGSGFVDELIVDEAGVAFRPGGGFEAGLVFLPSGPYTLSASLGGANDLIEVFPSFTGTLVADGGAGSDQYRVWSDNEPSMRLEIADTQGENWLELFASGSVEEYQSLYLDGFGVSDRGWQGVSLEASNAPGYEGLTLPGTDTQFAIKLRDEHSLSYMIAQTDDGSEVLALSVDEILVDELSDVDDGDYGVGKLSLREALRIAGRLPGKQTISFSTGLFGVVQETITLTSGAPGASDYWAGIEAVDPAAAADRPQQLVIDSEVEINGPGADLLAISGGGVTRIFNVTTTAPVAIRDLTVTEGYVDGSSNGGALYANTAGDLTIERTR